MQTNNKSSIVKSFLFILSGNLSTTPRAVKSILSIKKYCGCKIVLINRMEKWKSKDKELIAKHNLDVTTINLGRNPFFLWLLATIQEKIAQKVYPLFKKNICINTSASNKSSILLWQKIKSFKKQQFDLIIGHSAGSLYPAWKACKKWNIPFIFDVEDYHPGEFIRFDAANEKLRREFLMKQLLPEAAAITFASPLIEEYTLKLIGDHPNHQIIHNSFPASEFIEPTQNSKLTTHNSQLNFVWFSQKISFGRGLEQLFGALSQLITNNSQLTTHLSLLKITLIGDMDPDFERKIIQPLKTHNLSLTTHYSLLIKPPLSQPDLHAELANHDIGLAIEPGKDLNNNLALSNKIIAYTQAGLYTLATDTPAQKQFIEQFQEHGIICKQTSSGILDGITQIIKNKEQIVYKNKDRFNNAKRLCWETEEGKIKELIEGVVKSE